MLRHVKAGPSFLRAVGVGYGTPVLFTTGTNKSGEAGRYVASFVVNEVDIIFGSTLSALFTFLM